MAADRVDQHGPLSHQELATAVEHQDALTLGALHRHEAHAGPADRLADRRRVRRVILLPTHVRLYVRRRHQPHLVPERADLPRPEVRRRARLDADQARLERAEEAQHLGTPELLRDRDGADAINAVYLEDALGEVETDRGRAHGGRLLFRKVASQRPS